MARWLRLCTGLCVLAMAFASPACGEDDVVHGVSKPVTLPRVLSLDGFNGHIDAEAAQLQQRYPGAGGARIATYDAAYPADAEEDAAMGHYGVVMVAAITHDESELPLARVYISVRGKEYDLPRLMVPIRRAMPDGAAKAFFGPYRSDAFYLLPMVLFLDGDAVLMCDFTAHRTQFRLGGGDIKPPAYPLSEPGTPPNEAQLRAFIAREFPGFLE